MHNTFCFKKIGHGQRDVPNIYALTRTNSSKKSNILPSKCFKCYYLNKPGIKLQGSTHLNTIIVQNFSTAMLCLNP